MDGLLATSMQAPTGWDVERDGPWPPPPPDDWPAELSWEVWLSYIAPDGSWMGPTGPNGKPIIGPHTQMNPDNPWSFGEDQGEAPVGDPTGSPSQYPVPPKPQNWEKVVDDILAKGHTSIDGTIPLDPDDPYAWPPPKPDNFPEHMDWHVWLSHLEDTDDEWGMCWGSGCSTGNPDVTLGPIGSGNPRGNPPNGCIEYDSSGAPVWKAEPCSDEDIAQGAKPADSFWGPDDLQWNSNTPMPDMDAPDPDPVTDPQPEPEPQPEPPSGPKQPQLPDWDTYMPPKPEAPNNYLNTQYQPQMPEKNLVNQQDYIPPRYTDQPGYQPHYLQQPQAPQTQAPQTQALQPQAPQPMQTLPQPIDPMTGMPYDEEKGLLGGMK